MTLFTTYPETGCFTPALLVEGVFSRCSVTALRISLHVTAHFQQGECAQTHTTLVEPSSPEGALIIPGSPDENT